MTTPFYMSGPQSSITINYKAMKISKLFSSVLALCMLTLAGCSEKETQIEVSSVSLNTSTIEMVEGDSYKLVATVLPKDAEYDGVNWASSNASVASVSNGTVTALKQGTSTITASAGGRSATCTVKVAAKIITVTSVTLDKTSLSMKAGDTETLKATVNPTDATDKTITWMSSDVSVVTVSEGKLTAKDSGTATITAKAGNCTADCTVTVSVDVESVSLDITTLSLSVGESATLTATVKPDNASDKNVVWTSSDNSVATVSNGKVTAVKAGTATVKATCGGKTAECVVTVTAKVTGVKLNTSSIMLMSGDYSILKATIIPDNAANKNVKWESSNIAVATVDNGKVTAISEGTAKITVSTEEGQFAASCTVTVSDDITRYVSAYYSGGTILKVDDLIKYGSKLNFGVRNKSTKTINIKSVQLIDGNTGSAGNVMTIGYKIAGGSSAAWSISIGLAGIHEPIAKFVYEYNGTEYTTQAQYREFSW